MKSTNTATAPATVNTWTPSNAWTFAPEHVCVNGRDLPATYSLARTGDVYVFAKLGDLPVRIHVGPDMPMYASCLAAAKLAAKAAKPAPVQEAPKPAPVQAPAKADAPAPAKQAATKPAKAAKAEAPKPAPVQDASKPAPVQDAPKPAPVQAPAPALAAPAARPWIGTTITGKGWRIAFDRDVQRTRVVFDGAPTDAQKAAVLNAGFFWSSAMGSYNKHLTAKAYRAAKTLAAALSALA